LCAAVRACDERRFHSSIAIVKNSGTYLF
jgi:hypothetical protein